MRKNTTKSKPKVEDPEFLAWASTYMNTREKQHFKAAYNKVEHTLGCDPYSEPWIKYASKVIALELEERSPFWIKLVTAANPQIYAKGKSYN